MNKLTFLALLMNKPDSGPSKIKGGMIILTTNGLGSHLVSFKYTGMAGVDAKPRQNPAKIHFYGDFDYQNGELNAYSIIWKAGKVKYHVFLSANSDSGIFRTQFWLFGGKNCLFYRFQMHI